MNEYPEKGQFVEDFKIRTKAFAVRCIYLFRKLPKTDDARMVGRHCFAQQHQLLQIIAQPAEPEVKQNSSLN